MTGLSRRTLSRSLEEAILDKKESAVAALSRLRQLLGRDFREPEVQRAFDEAVSALGAMAEQETPFLIDLLGKTYERARSEPAEILLCSPICLVLGKCGSREAVPLLGRIFLDPVSRPIREDLADILGKLGDKTAVPFLLEGLSDNELWVRAKSAGSLGRLGERRAVPALRFRLEDESSDVREAAALALAELKASEASPELIKHLESDEDSAVRAAAAEALGEIGAGDAVQALRRVIAGDADEDVISAASEALGNL